MVKLSNNGVNNTGRSPRRPKKDLMELAHDYREAKTAMQRAEYQLGQRQKELEKIRRAMLRMLLAESRAAAESKVKFTP